MIYFLIGAIIGIAIAGGNGLVQFLKNWRRDE